MSSPLFPQRPIREKKATRAEQFPPDSIGFRPVRISDLPTLTRWLAEPHVRNFYQKTPVSLAEVAAEYEPVVSGETPDICHLALNDGAPFAYLQCYRNVDYPNWTAIIEVNDGLSVDLFIGEPDYLGRGFGRLMLSEYLPRIAFPYFVGEACAYIAHELANAAALRCSQAAGFRPFREFLEDGIKMLLLAKQRGPIMKQPYPDSH